MKTPRRLTLSAVPGIPLLQQGDDLGAIVIAAIAKATGPVRRRYRGGAQKAVSKSQGRTVDLATVTPSWHARSSPSR